MNALNAMPNSLQTKTKGHLHDIWQARTCAEAEVVFDFFVKICGAKWDKTDAKRVKNRTAVLHDFPAEHWKHIRTSNPPSRAGKNALPDHNRTSLRHRPAPHKTQQWVPQPQDRAGHGLQTDEVGAEERAEPRRPKSLEFQDGNHHVQAAA
jgi:hypothetical protein